VVVIGLFGAFTSWLCGCCFPCCCIRVRWDPRKTLRFLREAKQEIQTEIQTKAKAVGAAVATSESPKKSRTQSPERKAEEPGTVQKGEPGTEEPAEEKTAVAPGTVQVDGVEKRVEHLRQKKEVFTAYVLWLVAGLVGAHHFYLDRIAHGVLATSTLNFLGVGWCVDMICMGVYVLSANKNVASMAKRDGSCRRVCWRFPLAGILYVAVVFAGFIAGPRSLHDMGLFDIDAMVADTKSNPYELLGIHRNDSVATAIRAWRETKEKTCLQLDAKDRTLCKAQVKEMKKAFNFIATYQGRPEEAEEIASAVLKKKKKKKGKKDGKNLLPYDNASAEWKAIGNFVYAKGNPYYKKLEKWVVKYKGGEDP